MCGTFHSGKEGCVPKTCGSVDGLAVGDAEAFPCARVPNLAVNPGALAAEMESRLRISDVLGLSSIEGGGSTLRGSESPNVARAARSSASLLAAVVWAAHSAPRAAHECCDDADAPGARLDSEDVDVAWGML